MLPTNHNLVAVQYRLERRIAVHNNFSNQLSYNSAQRHTLTLQQIFASSATLPCALSCCCWICCYECVQIPCTLGTSRSSRVFAWLALVVSLQPNYLYLSEASKCLKIMTWDHSAARLQQWKLQISKLYKGRCQQIFTSNQSTLVANSLPLLDHLYWFWA